MSNKRPENSGPPELFYNENEAKKYTSSSRIIDIQEQLSRRSIELLLLPDDKSHMLLDLGCGSGLSGECLDEEGHMWIGLDISKSMLDIALERNVNGDLLLSDLGNGMPFRAGMFDGAISISTLQWLCHSNTSTQNVPKRLFTLFSSLYASLSIGARAVFQLYPENSSQMELITQQAMKAGFTGGLVIDYPNSTKAKKLYLVLMAGGPAQPLPQGLGTETTTQTSRQVQFTSSRQSYKQLKGKSMKKSKDWILEKKERRRRQGREVRDDSKYTGRKRVHGW